MIDVSVIVLTNNRSERCLDSVRHNASSIGEVKAEFLVINNGRQALSVPNDLGGIPCRILQMSRNLGAAARNEGLRVAQGRYILTLDDDAYIDPGLAANMVRAFDADPSLGALTFRIHNGKEEESCLLPTVFHGCACGFRRKALEEAGGYPPDYLYYGEEYDLAFRLYQRGYRIGLCNHGKMVRHVRDTKGRDIHRILRLLVRNNVYLWVAMLPWSAVGLALYDTLLRYALIARKEKAWRGYWAGLMALPAAVLRALRRRKPMNPDVFEVVSLNSQMRRVAEELHRRNLREVILCGVGKFPSLWIRTLRRNGIRVRQFLDFNPCWQGHRVRGIPVRTVLGGGLPARPPGVGFITGTASLADNARWLHLLEAPPPSPEATTGEQSSGGGIFDLHRAYPVKLYGGGYSKEIGGFSLVAPALLYCVPAD